MNQLMTSSGNYYEMGMMKMFPFAQDMNQQYMNPCVVNCGDYYPSYYENDAHRCNYETASQGSYCGQRYVETYPLSYKYLIVILLALQNLT